MVFGPLTGVSLSDKKSALRKQFAYLARTVHPDHVPRVHADLAAEAFRLLNELRAGAEAALEAGTYDKPLSGKSAHDTAHGHELTSPAGVYRIPDDPIYRGDFSALFRGKRLGSDPTPVLVKIAFEPALNQWLEREALVLRRFADGAHPAHKVCAYVPEILDTFVVQGERGARHRANVLRFVQDFVSLADVIKAYPRGLDPQDVAWIYRRVIGQALAAELLGVVHGAITPAHVLVNPFTHEPRHIGWAHAIEKPWDTGARVTHVIDEYREYYPPEVFDKKPPTAQTDIYMAGKTAISLLGGNVRKNTLPSSVPDSIARVILRAVEENPARRPQDGMRYLDEFTRVVRETWGRKYRPLSMPV